MDVCRIAEGREEKDKTGPILSNEDEWFVNELRETTGAVQFLVSYSLTECGYLLDEKRESRVDREERIRNIPVC